MSHYTNLTKQVLLELIAITTPEITNYLTRFQEEIEFKILKHSVILKLPLHPQKTYELNFIQDIEKTFKQVLEVKTVTTHLHISKDYLSVQEYQRFTATTAIYPKHQATNYLGLGLVSEAGEVAGVLKKWIRGDYSTKVAQEKIIKELGDVLWYVARLADEQNIPLVNVFTANMEKLQSRQEKGVIKGDGDDR